MLHGNNESICIESKHRKEYGLKSPPGLPHIVFCDLALFSFTFSYDCMAPTIARLSPSGKGSISA